jgi:hypothetical protein
MNTVLLSYNMEGQELKKLKALCARKDVRLRRVLPEEYAQPIGAFCGVEKRTDATPEMPLPTQQLLLFAGFGDRQLEMFLGEMKTARIGAGALKAALTPTNAKWDSCALFRELTKERETMG